MGCFCRFTLQGVYVLLFRMREAGRVCVPTWTPLSSGRGQDVLYRSHHDPPPPTPVPTTPNDASVRSSSRLNIICLQVKIDSSPLGSLLPVTVVLPLSGRGTTERIRGWKAKGRTSVLSRFFPPASEGQSRTEGERELGDLLLFFSAEWPSTCLPLLSGLAGAITWGGRREAHPERRQ